MSTGAWLQLAVFMALLLALAWPLARGVTPSKTRKAGGMPCNTNAAANRRTPNFRRASWRGSGACPCPPGLK